MLRNRLYYYVKPVIPWRVRIAIRRGLASIKRKKVTNVWPIAPGADQQPKGWPGWPNGRQFALVLTHDVEGVSGLNKCAEVMRLEEEYGFRSSFNFAPEAGYSVPPQLREQLNRNGFEVGVHDLHHDGKLFHRQDQFSRSASRINHYLHEWNAVGFRSAFMLHNLDWLHGLNIQYDSSTFDTDPFEPQPHGRHTIFPFWIPRPALFNVPYSGGNRDSASRQPGYVELPYTVPQDSTLFLLFRERNPDIWFKKLDWIAERGGMALIDTHPDYMSIGSSDRKQHEYPGLFYQQFLEYVREKYRGAYWHALPKDVAAQVAKNIQAQTEPNNQALTSSIGIEARSHSELSLKPLGPVSIRVPTPVNTPPLALSPASFFARGPGRPALGSVTIFGMGYVGCVSAACLARNGYQVTGVDVDPNKVELLNSGRSPISEPGLDEIVTQAVADELLNASTGPRRLGQIAMVCVGTPSNENGSLDLGQVLRVSEEIGDLLRHTDSYHVIDFRSTVVPGTVEGLLIPLLEEKSCRKAGRDFGVCMNPEFLRESTAIKDFYNPPFTIIGALDERSGSAVAQLYAGIDAPLEIVPIRVAEMIKYACNSFHALKVSFANEIGNLCKSFGIDSWQVMNIFCKDKKLNLSSYYLRPGFAFGGSCLPKDLRAIVHLARQRDVELPVLGSILASNELQIERAYRMVRRTGLKKVGMLGLSFKTGSDDLRESPTVALVERLIGKGYSVSIYDDDVSLPDIVGKNRQFIERTLPHIASLMKSSLVEVIDRSEVIAICKKRPDFLKALAVLNGKHAVIDLVRMFNDDLPASLKYEGICW